MYKISSIITLTLLFVFALAGISCNRDKVSSKGTANLTPEQSKKLEAYRKSMEESKKVVVAKVNGVDILMSELIKEMNEIAPKYIAPGQTRDAQLDEKIRKNESSKHGR